ncbi:hypothetical protein F2Q68_00023475 [Brassica cretica]|uniref:Uncharacterized protein n=1 Tax=Brassica cretica TaxID=69181 RepID=A0A8S9FSI8_BRACR|nr:hypothetical protein F2Q68_00023475 [Brassica cretica]
MMEKRAILGFVISLSPTTLWWGEKSISPSFFLVPLRLHIISDLRSSSSDKRGMATATYPPPPPYYRLYKDYSENPNSAPSPSEGTYVCFGGNYTRKQAVEDIKRRREEVQRLLKDSFITLDGQ